MQSEANIKQIVTDGGQSIEAMSQDGLVMLIFLRHFGCIFCREALKDVKKQRSNWEKKGIQVVLIYPSDKASGAKYLSQFDLLNTHSISDPSCALYEEFGLGKGNTSQLFGLNTFFRGFETMASGTLPVLKQVGDGFQMPGIFMIHKGQIGHSYIHKTISDKPDYNELTACCIT